MLWFTELTEKDNNLEVKDEIRGFRKTYMV